MAPLQPARPVPEQTRRQRGGRASILDRQSRDHAVLDELIAAYERATGPRARARAVSRLSDRALRHAFAEETVLFPAYRRHLPHRGDELSAHVEGDHQRINDLLEHLQDADPMGPTYDGDVRRVIEAIRHDARTEEDVLLPELQQVAGARELRSIGRAWEAVRTVAPTRPHPRLRRRPPQNALAAVPLAVGDRVKDAVTSPGAASASGAQEGTSLPVAVLAGIAAGAAGVAAMTVTEKVEQAFTGRSDSIVPGRTLQALLGVQAQYADGDRAFNLGMHWGQGALLGAVRGVMARAGYRGLAGSLVFSAARLTADQSLENGTGVGTPPWTWPRTELAVDVAHKLVYGLVTGAVADALVRPRRSRG